VKLGASLSRAALAVGWLASTLASAEPLALLAPPSGDDARKAIAIGPAGEVYAPDATGTWVRTQPFATADALSIVGRAGGDVVAAGDGAVYKLAPNGWSAIRLHQKDKAMMAGGSRAVAAVKRQLYALDRTKAGEPEKLALAPAAVLAIGAGKTIVIATDRGLARVDGKKVTPIAGAPKQVLRLIDDKWAIVAIGAYDLRANKAVSWPAGAKLQTAASGPDDSLVAVIAIGGKRELVTVARGKLGREPIDASVGAAAVGLAVDRAGRAGIAFADGQLAVRERGAWSTTTVKTALPAARPGPAPARSP
jgi:hypothetical protein